MTDYGWHVNLYFIALYFMNIIHLSLKRHLRDRKRFFMNKSTILVDKIALQRVKSGLFVFQKFASGRILNSIFLTYF